MEPTSTAAKPEWSAREVDTVALDNAPEPTVVLHLWVPTGQPTDLRVPAAFEGLPAVRIVGVQGRRGSIPPAYVLASNQEGTLLGELVTHANAIEARLEEISAHRWRRPDGSETPWRDGPPQSHDEEGELELAYAVRAPVWGGDRTLDPMQPARWCRLLDSLIKGPLSESVREPGAVRELSRLRSWIEREANPQLRRELFEGGAITGATRIPVARTAASSAEPTDSARGYDDGWNACRVVVAHAAPGAKLPPARIQAGAHGRRPVYDRGYDEGWNACLFACQRDQDDI